MSGLEKVESAKISWNQRDLSPVPSLLTLSSFSSNPWSTYGEVEV